MSKQPKFVISGEIEKDQQSPQRNGPKSQNGLIVFVVLFMLSVVYIIYLHMSVFQMNNKVQMQGKNGESLDSLYAELSKFSEKVDSLDLINLKLKNSNDMLLENILAVQNNGVFYEVQLGSFTDFNLDKYEEELAALRQEKYDGKTKVILGRFRSLKRALLFENDMRRIGFTDSYIVGRIDGTLVDYKDAIEEQKKREGVSQ